MHLVPLENMNAPLGVTGRFLLKSMNNTKEKQNLSLEESRNYKNDEVQHKNYTEKEAAAFLRTSTVSLWRARNMNLLTYRRVMGKILYTENDLLDFLERSKRGFNQ